MWKEKGNVEMEDVIVMFKNVKCYLGQDRIDLLYVDPGVPIGGHYGKADLNLWH